MKSLGPRIISTAFLLAIAAPAWPHGWVATAPGLNARTGHALAYDAQRMRVVLFGGSGFNDTWEYDGNFWTPGPLAPGGLTPRGNHAMAYDTIRHVTVLFGGNDGADRNDTWEYDGNAWSAGPAAPAPLLPRSGHSMAFLNATKQMIVYGGNVPADTWEYDGIAWTAGGTPPAGLGARTETVMAVDTIRNRAIVFGGLMGATLKNDTWEYDGASWFAGGTAPAGLTARRSSCMTFDLAQAKCVLFGGFDGTAYSNQVWQYNGTTWASGSAVPVGFTPRADAAMTFDSTQVRSIVFGGGGPQPLSDTWSYNGFLWSQSVTAPPAFTPRTGTAMAYDSTRNKTVLFGGDDGIVLSNEGEEYDGAAATWTVAPPTPALLTGRSGHAMAFDSARNLVIIFGGNDGAYLNDVWEYNGVNFVQGPAAPGGLTGRSRVAISFDSTRSRVVIFGGKDGTSYFNETWEYNGAWAAGPAAPPMLTPRAGAAMAYAVPRQRTVLFGGGNASSQLSDTWEYNGTVWTAGPSAPAGLSAREQHGVVYDSQRALIVLYGGTSGTASFDDCWQYDGTTWSVGPASPALLGKRHGFGFAYDTTRHRAILFGGTVNRSGYASDTWEYDSLLWDYLVGAGHGDPNPNRVRIFSTGGAPTGTDFLAYTANKFGTNVANGDIDNNGTDDILTGPGPGTVFGPQVRGFRGVGTAIGKINYYAYGTLKYGVNVAAGSVDADAFSEIVTGAGPGSVFGPHVRGWNFDGTAITAIAKISFFAYGTLKYGVNVALGNIDLDPFEEIVTAPGPGAIFGPQIRGWNYDGVGITSINKVNFNAFTVAQYGANVATGDVDGDGIDEILCAPGPGPGSSFPSEFRGFNYDGTVVLALAGFDITPFDTSYGGRLGSGNVYGTGADELIVGSGPDPAADTTVRAYGYNAGTLDFVPGSFLAFPTLMYGCSPTGGDFGL